MRPRIVFLGIALFISIYYSAIAQELTQVIRGQVLDIESETPLAFATITVVTTDSLIGTIADINGQFRFKEIPVGRHT